jgi:hypothetical protein
VWTLSPGERPNNILIELSGPTTLAVTTFGYPGNLSRRAIALYVDQPGAFAGDVARPSMTACAQPLHKSQPDSYNARSFP